MWHVNINTTRTETALEWEPTTGRGKKYTHVHDVTLLRLQSRQSHSHHLPHLHSESCLCCWGTPHTLWSEVLFLGSKPGHPPLLPPPLFPFCLYWLSSRSRGATSPKLCFLQAGGCHCEISSHRWGMETLLYPISLCQIEGDCEGSRGMCMHVCVQAERGILTLSDDK